MDFDEWEPTPPDPDPEQSCLSMRIDAALSELQSGLDGDLAFGVSHGMASLEVAMGSSRRPEGEDTRRELLSALAKAHVAVRLKWSELDQDEIANGIDAAIGQAIYIFESEERRRAIKSEELGLLGAHARILRNELHNRSLLRGLPRAREMHRTGRYSLEQFATLMQRDFGRIATNEIMNEQLRAQIRGKPTPSRILRLVA